MLLDHLNPEQLAAVTLPTPQHALILAGAGSGKTRVLTTRVAWLLQQGEVSPSGVLAVTFTNKAAKEMLARLSTLLPVNARGMWIGTFHGLCNRFLRAHHQLAQLPPGFQILDTQDQLSAIKRLMKQFNVDEERYPAKQLQWFIAGSKEDGLRPHDLTAQDPDSQRKTEFYALYEAQCQREGVVDFAELMLRTYEILRDHAHVRSHYQARFKHILVDEFQDTNALQYAWLKLLAGPSSSVFAVGDDDQSIYAFRGAKVSNMQDFVREFGVGQAIKLENNYRSFGHILDSANHLIEHNQQRLGKNLRTEQGPGEPVRINELPSDFAEAQWVVEEMAQLVREGQARHQLAVLYRSNAQSRVLETALFNAGMPYRVYGGLRFFERAEVKHALAYLRLLQNPRDDTSFLRAVNFPARGIGARALEQLQDCATTAACSLHDAVHLVSGKAGAHLSAFVAMLQTWREASTGMNLREIVEWVLQHSGLIEHYEREKEGADRIENLQELVNAAESFVGIEGFGKETPAVFSEALVNPDSGETLSPLAAFLSHAALEAGDNQAHTGQDAVQLMTVHAAKGLEFNCVFITGLEEGLFPHENSATAREGLEEERRLMYVAITRARERLYLSCSQTRLLHGNTRYNIRSRFLDELPSHAIKWIASKSSGFSSSTSNPWQMGSATSGWSKNREPRENRWTGQRDEAWWQKPKTSPGARSAAVQTSTTGPGPTRGAHANIQVGMGVFHNKFGEGRVLSLEGQGEDARAQVQFKRHGVKWLALAIAQLTPI